MPARWYFKMSTNNTTKSSTSDTVFGMVFLLIIGLVVYMCCCGGCDTGPSQYDRDLENGINKVVNGRSSELTQGERQAANDFFEWQSKQ